MAKSEIRKPGNRAAALQNGKVRIESDFAQNNHEVNVPQQFQFPFQKRPAIPQFLRGWFVAGRRAMCRGGDPGVA
jgi:hypothetical protein